MVFWSVLFGRNSPTFRKDMLPPFFQRMKQGFVTQKTTIYETSEAWHSVRFLTRERPTTRAPGYNCKEKWAFPRAIEETAEEKKTCNASTAIWARAINPCRVVSLHQCFSTRVPRTSFEVPPDTVKYINKDKSLNTAKIPNIPLNMLHSFCNVSWYIYGGGGG